MKERNYMKYINIEECLSSIQKNRIDREHGANVYLMRNEKEVILEFAYSQAKEEHFILAKKVFGSPNEIEEGVWQEYLAVSMIIETKYKIRRFVDDIRSVWERKSV